VNENPTNAEEQLKLGDKYYYGTDGIQENLDKAAYWYTKAAEQGHVIAQFYLGDIYFYGKGVLIDSEKAKYWYEKAAEQGHILSQRNVGNYYYKRGSGIQDKEKAAYWYMKAAEQGDAMSQYNMGVDYYYGNPFPKDIEKAKYWFTKSAEGGDKDAKAMLTKIESNFSGETSSTDGVGIGKVLKWVAIAFGVLIMLMMCMNL
jgi:TPR repeat protein